MNKKILVAMIMIAIASINVVSVFAVITWYDSPTINLTAQTSTSPPPVLSAQNNVATKGIDLLVSTDCAGISSAASGHNFGPIATGDTSTWTLYVYNPGSSSVNLTYSPADYLASGGKTQILVTVQVAEYGPKCQTTATGPNQNSVVLPFTLPETGSTTNNISRAISPPFSLDSNKEAKLTITITRISSDPNTPYSIPFVLSGTGQSLNLFG